jgi:hypothetical protein
MRGIEKTVFVSYRRADESWGLAIFENLTHHGYDVFIDYDGIASGQFDTIIFENIRARAHFLILLTPTALERCDDSQDWMRREIEAAIDNKRNIVPLMLAGFEFGTPTITEQLTGKLTAIKKYNALRVPEGYFNEAMNRLRDKFLNVPLDTVLHSASPNAQKDAAEQKDRAVTALADPEDEQAPMDRLRDEHLNVPPDSVPHAASPNAQKTAVEQNDRAATALADQEDEQVRQPQQGGRKSDKANRRRQAVERVVFVNYPKDFQIGLAISGAVSAGAYAAGVFDFLIQALDEWEQERYEPSGSAVPSHRVGLKVISGASAGAITAGIGAIALADADSKPGTYFTTTFAYRYYLPRLYDAWVVKPTLVAETDGTPDFLTLTDLDSRPKPENDFSHTSGIAVSDKGPILVTSLLNAQLLDTIAKAAIDVERVGTPRAYLSKTLHIYLTLTNLRGVPYQIPFQGGPYHMISHGDRVHYALNDLGTWPEVSAFGDQDKKRTLEVAWLETGDKGQKDEWRDYSICAIASGAFPVGLSPRLIGAKLGTVKRDNEYDGRLFPIEDIVNKTNIRPNFSRSVLSETPFWFTCADGGIIDNDPFEYAKFCLKDDQKFDQHIGVNVDEVDRAVIMISAFPEEKPIRQEGEPYSDIVSVFSALMPALINQARFKPGELALAGDEAQRSRYLIRPKRTVGEERERYALASGLLGGFGGFVARSFRDHDFQLGRRNCQKFLRSSFGLSEANPVVRSWAATVDRKQVEMGGTDNRPLRYGLVPLLGSGSRSASIVWRPCSSARTLAASSAFCFVSFSCLGSGTSPA